MDKSKRKTYFNKVFILSAVIIAVIIFVIYQFSLPQIAQILEIRQGLRQEKNRLEQLTKKSTTLEKLSEQELKDEFQRIQEALPSEKDVAGLLYALARLENESSVVVGAVELKPGLISTPSASASPSAESSAVATPSGEKKKPDKPTTSRVSAPRELASLNFDLDLAGDFQGLRNFLDKIIEINPLLTISSLSLSTKDDLLIAKLDINYNYQLLPSFYLKVDDPLSVLTTGDKDTLAEISRWPVYSKMPETATSSVGKVNPFW